MKISTYSQAGIDRIKEEKVVNMIMSSIRQNHLQNKNVLPFGSYAGGTQFGDYILSLATDGVGSKVILAEELEKWDTIGIDCVAMNVNDLISIGSIPQSFVDYIAIKKLNEYKINEIIKGVIEGCNISEVSLVGGETAVLPELFNHNYFDLAGTALGIHKKGSSITGSSITESDVIIGIESSGIHSNGLTLARNLFSQDEISWKKELLTPTRIYVGCIKELLLSEVPINGLAHITGGGFRNLLRLGKFNYALDYWETTELFKEIALRGDIQLKEMYSTFNMGFGFIVITSKENEDKVLMRLNSFFPSATIGKVKAGNSVTVGGLKL